MTAQPAIELEALSKRYGPTVGIEDLDLEVRQGEVFGFLGPNGSGKTTTIRCLVGLLTPTAGLVQALQHDPEVAILDEPTEGLDPLVQETFFALLDEAKDAGRTVFLSSHVLAEVQRTCGRVAIVRGGRLATVQAVEELRDARARRVRLTFAHGVDRDRVPVAAHWSPAWSERTLRLLVEGAEVVPALRRLLELPVTDLAVEEAGLDEAFLAFYRQAEAEAGTVGGRSA